MCESELRLERFELGKISRMFLSGMIIYNPKALKCLPTYI